MTTPSRSHRRPARRFRPLFCRFHAIGIVVREAELSRTRDGRPSARLSMMVDDARDLELLVTDRDPISLQRRLAGAVPGATVYAEGQVFAPRIDRHELPQFVAELVVVFKEGEAAHAGDHGEGDQVPAALSLFIKSGSDSPARDGENPERN